MIALVEIESGDIVKLTVAVCPRVSSVSQMYSGCHVIIIIADF